MTLHLSALWGVVVLHQVALPSGRLPLHLWGLSDHLFRRSLHNGPERIDPPIPCSMGGGSLPPSGLLLNWEKSILLLRTAMEFLGFTVDLVAASLSPPSLKQLTIRKENRKVLTRPHVTIHHLAKVTGLLAMSIQTIFPTPLHYQALQHLKINHLRERASYGDWITLDHKVKDELRWWIS